jgi:ATP-binding cassette subfamily F protein 3
LGIIGPNGSGKTTFLKTILNQIPALAGEIRWGTKVQIGYYAQQLDDLDDRNEIIMELRRVAPSSATAGELRSFLAKFLFTGDDVYKHVRDLSGGEKGRLALAKLIYSRVNVLVLDEPTNHLDIPSREALEEALSAFEGTIVTISHDRYFLDRVATQILALDGVGNAEHYDGDYTEYHDWKAGRSGAGEPVALIAKPKTESQLNGGPTAVAPQVNEVRADQGKHGKKGSASKPQPRGVKVVKKSRPAARPAEAVETEIAQAEKLLNELSEKMSAPEIARDPTRLLEITTEYQSTEKRLGELYEEWERFGAESANG